MNKKVKQVQLLNSDGAPDLISSVRYTDYNSLVAEFKRGKFDTLLCRSDKTYLVTFTDGSTELWRNSPGDPPYVYTKVKDEPVNTDEGMCYKDALEYMEISGLPTWNKYGTEYQIKEGQLYMGGILESQPLLSARWNQSYYRAKPKPVYIPF